MIDDAICKIRVYHNPWDDMISDDQLVGFLHRAAINAENKLKAWIQSGDVPATGTSFGAVLLDPTRPRGAVTLADRLLAAISIGPGGDRLIPNGAAKADAADRHGVSNAILVDERSHCLGNGDFAWGANAEYDGAIGGGSGLSGKQDRILTHDILRDVMDPVRALRDHLIAELRKQGSHGWYNHANEPGSEYAGILALPSLISTM